MDLNAMTVSRSNEVVDVAVEIASSRGRANSSFGGSENRIHNALAHQGPSDLGGSFEYNVKVFRQLERGDHITPQMRTRLLTWYSLRATDKERRVVNAYISVLGSEPSSLAKQLFDSFPDVFDINKKPRT